MSSDPNSAFFNLTPNRSQPAAPGRVAAEPLRRQPNPDIVPAEPPGPSRMHAPLNPDLAPAGFAMQPQLGRAPPGFVGTPDGMMVGPNSGVFRGGPAGFNVQPRHAPRFPGDVPGRAAPFHAPFVAPGANAAPLHPGEPRPDHARPMDDADDAAGPARPPGAGPTQPGLQSRSGFDYGYI